AGVDGARRRNTYRTFLPRPPGTRPGGPRIPVPRSLVPGRVPGASTASRNPSGTTLSRATQVGGRPPRRAHGSRVSRDLASDAGLESRGASVGGAGHRNPPDLSPGKFGSAGSGPSPPRNVDRPSAVVRALRVRGWNAPCLDPRGRFDPTRDVHSPRATGRHGEGSVSGPLGRRDASWSPALPAHRAGSVSRVLFGNPRLANPCLLSAVQTCC